MEIFTVGHSAHEKIEFLNILKSFGIKTLVDVRSYPGSRFVPHFNRENMSVWLEDEGIEYVHLPELGGRRRKSIKDDAASVAGWTNIAFRNYAAYSLSEDFEEGIDKLIKIAEKGKTCIMCAESVPWRCHRLLISNVLYFKGIRVFHVLGEKKAILHEINKFGAEAVFEGGKVKYPEKSK